jgi:hypothetical protein
VRLDSLPPEIEKLYTAGAYDRAIDLLLVDPDNKSERAMLKKLQKK